MGVTELQSNWPEMQKTLVKPGFCSTGFRKLAEWTGIELLAGFPMFLKSSRGTFLLWITRATNLLPSRLSEHLDVQGSERDHKSIRRSEIA